MSSLQSLPPSVTQFFLPSLTPPQTPSSFVELANLSNVNKEWRDKVIGAFVVKDKEGRREVNKNLRRCLCWFDEEGIETRSVSMRRGKSHHSKTMNLATTWLGKSTTTEILGFFGFTKSFCDELEERMRGEGKGLVIGSKVAYPSSRLDEPQVLMNHTSGLPAIQFLNCDGTYAVRMRTNEFECGPVPQPITIFMVGVAMEDGCFISGLRGRFEVGHLYPSSDIEEAMDMSKVVMSASRGNRATKGVIERVDRLKFQRSSSEDSSSDESDLSMDSVPPVNNIVKGKTRPGRWHLYTCVFDGNTSVLRVDGQEEGRGSAEDDGGVGEGHLTGLTIGSDHCFNMSLCDGGAGLTLDNGVGGGAIAEVAAFEGVMCSEDMEFVEGKLIEKHKITKGTKETLREDEWKFDAHALITQPPPWRLKRKVPLRVAAREKSVVWKREDPVTGEKVIISRIGTTKTGSDSEW